MENLQPETHQYYFERYLREKLSAEEKVEFEEKLAKDIDLQLALNAYKQHRKQFLKEIIAEHSNKPSKTSFINFIYLAITIAGIVITLNFYLENKTLKEERQRNKNLITRLIEYIPFIGKKGNEDADVKRDKKNAKKTARENETELDGSTLPTETLPDDEITENQTLLLDSVLAPVPRDYLNDRLSYFQKEVDSTLTAQEILKMIYRNAAKNEARFKTRPIGIKIWLTTQTTSYAYDGHLLNLYLKETPEELSLINDEGELVWLNATDETILIADNEIHPFTE